MEKINYIRTVVLAVIFVPAFILFLILLSGESNANENELKNDRITMILSQVEKLKKMPNDLPAHLKVPPKEGYNFVKIVVTISRAENIYLISADAVLIDSESREYKKIIMGFTGGTLKDRTDVNSLLYFGKGSTFTSFYEVSNKVNLSNIKIDYNYLNSLKENKKESRKGQLVIKISQ